MRRLLLPALLLALFLAPAVPAQGQDWEFRISPYFWAAGLTGDFALGPNAPTVRVEVGFDDIFDDLQLGLMAAGEARRGRFAWLGDFSYVDTGSRTAVGGPAVAFAQVDTESFVGTAAAAYRGHAGDRFSLDVLGGIRGVWVDTKLTLTPTSGAPIAGDRDESWWDPVFGIRALADLSARWSLTGYGDVGGGGSDYTYQLYGAVNLQISEHWRLSGGYRYYSVKYEDEGYLYEVAQDGLLLGVTLGF
jgi:hypothetical protein